jgi:hypothetical protein
MYIFKSIMSHVIINLRYAEEREQLTLSTVLQKGRKNDKFDAKIFSEQKGPCRQLRTFNEEVNFITFMAHRKLLRCYGYSTQHVCLLFVQQFTFQFFSLKIIFSF